jgi:antitoxin CcdA
MSSIFDTAAPKRSVNMSLNEDLVREARKHTSSLSAEVERLLADWLAQIERNESAEQKRLDAALDRWNAFYDRYGSFADEHSTL